MNSFSGTSLQLVLINYFASNVRYHLGVMGFRGATNKPEVLGKVCQAFCHRMRKCNQ